MVRSISNSDDVIDSRDVIARLGELQDEREDLSEKLAEWDGEKGEELRALEALAVGGQEHDAERLEELREERGALVSDLEEWDEDNGDELKALTALNDEGDGATSDWPHGETLIRESYFEEYCQEMVQDIGDLPKELPSYLVIDWEKTADNLKYDYSEVDFDGVTYLVRS